MNFFVKNENFITTMSRYGNVANYTTCNNECRAKNLRPFQMQDFYNYDDHLNDTNFLDENYTEHFHSNITESLPKFGTISNDEEFELCTNVQFDFENRIWTDESALFNSIHKWEQKFGQLWVGEKHY